MRSKGGSNARLCVPTRDLRPQSGKDHTVWPGTGIKAPLGIIHGEGDRVLGWKRTGKKLFDALSPAASPFLYLADREVNHINVAVSLPFSSAEDREIFKECLALCVAFFQKHPRGEGEELERRLGSAGTDPRRVTVYQLQKESARRFFYPQSRRIRASVKVMSGTRGANSATLGI